MEDLCDWSEVFNEVDTLQIQKNTSIGLLGGLLLQ
jgi:hypothetical protein